jgi:hypothetical protein
MTNGDYNPFFEHENLPSDMRQRRIGVATSVIAAIIVSLLLVWLLLAMRG